MTKPQPEGWPTVVPRLMVADPAGLVTFIKRVFEAEGELPPGRPAELRIGDSLIMVSGTEVREATTSCLYVYVPDTDAAHQRAVEAGATSVESPRDTPYGDRRAIVSDRWGNRWQIATRIRPAPQ